MPGRFFDIFAAKVPGRFFDIFLAKVRRDGSFLAVASLALFAVAAVDAAESSTQPFVDSGDPASLLEALEAVRPALPDGEPELRARVDQGIAVLSEGKSLADALHPKEPVGKPVQVLLTGYYEPILDARRRADQTFRYPLYALPSRLELRNLSRQEIDSGALKGQGLELFWLDDPVESFFLHVQGSGRLRLGDGSTVRVGYAGNNGRAYHSIGSELVERGVFTPKQATAPALKKWLRENPSDAWEVLHTNSRFIYFRELTGPLHQGPIGAAGVPLVPLRSVAVDPAHTPLGTIGFLTAKMPDGSTLRHTVVAMDAGAAIRGPSRLDLFLGAGSRAGRVAGELRAKAVVTWLD